MEAKKACPDIIMVIADSAKYSRACERLIAIWSEFTPVVELFSIDEAFLDVTGCEALFGDPVRIALRIKERIWEEMGLLCSIGIAPNKLLAKLGSDLQKPDGLVLITPDFVADVLEDLPVQQICGIGPNLTKKLASMGIRRAGNWGARRPACFRHGSAFSANGSATWPKGSTTTRSCLPQSRRLRQAGPWATA
jgi:DNA polymerase-4